ncbi:MAG: polyprenyl synthetase family protein [Bacteroidia bacterium]|nr:polyprenyl synthetase family protein [Bacteroidia bacterium]
MDRNTILEYLGTDWQNTESLIRSSLSSDIDLLNSTNISILDHSGKQLRPMMSLLMAKACGNGTVCKDSILFAAATELLHNATLLHDDVADKSETRRGMPTVASLLGDTPSVLVGDFWLVKAVETVIASEHHGEDVIRLFSKTLTDLAEGEMLQLQKASTGDTSEKDYFRIIYSKTASLFIAGCLSAAISVDAPEEIKDAARHYAEALGLAYQVKDDIMDYEGGDIGKPTGVDLKEKKITLPLLGALSKVSEKEGERIRSMVCSIDEHPENISDIVAFVKENEGVPFAENKLAELCNRAAGALSVLPDSQAKSFLVELAIYTGERKK